MAKTDNQDRAAFLTPLIRGALSALAHVIAGMDAAEVQASLQRMATDPTEVLIWENAGPRAWQAYDAGGPLKAERIELTLAPSLAGIGIDALLVLLGSLSDEDHVRVLATPEPWRFLVRAPGLPRVTVETHPVPDVLEDLVIRIMVGANGPAERLFKPELMTDAWRRQTAQALQAWLAVNQARPLSDHPAFAEVVEAPALGMPGVYLVRTPPLPYSPFLAVSVYQNPVSWAVIETEEELASCRAYYRTPGASFFAELPLFRNRPPCSAQPARLAGAIAPNRVRVVRTPWEGVGAISVYTLPDDLLQKRPGLRQEAYRGRYLVHGADNADQALAAWRRVGIKAPVVEWPVAGNA